MSNRGSFGLVAVALLIACSGLGRSARAPLPVASEATRRALSTGELVGFEAVHGSHAWLDIPFARPPVAELRWRAPRPPQPWRGVRQALASGAPCPQLPSPFAGVDAKPGTPVGSEDCLTLNVWAPRFSAAAVPSGPRRLPVMLWIHGGGNTIGHAGLYDGAHLAAAHDLVVITTNYRLGPLGWFRHRSLGSGALDRSGNFGTLDLVRALTWVQENATAFGGDPGNVTIFGESAGARNVLSLLLSPRAEGLFHRAIVQSGVMRSQSVAEAENLSDDPEPGHENSAGEVLLRLLVRDGTASDRATAKAHVASLGDAGVARYLRAVDAGELLASYATDGVEFLLDVPQVFRDGTVLPADDPYARLGRRGGYSAVPVMLGTNRDEDKLFMAVHPKLVRRIFGIPLWRIEPAFYELKAEYQSKLWKAGGADEIAQSMSRVQRAGVFVYRFDWDEEPRLPWIDLSTLVGAGHGLEIPFVFGHFDLGRAARVLFDAENEPGRLELSTRMMSYWAQFAYSGDPGQGRDGRQPRWERWGADRPGFLVLDTDAGGGPRMSDAIVTKASVIAEIERDPRLGDPARRCRLYRELALYGRRFDHTDYAQVGCEAGYPLALRD